MWKELSKIVDLFYSLSFLLFLNGIQAQRLCRLPSVDAQPGITPALRSLVLGELQTFSAPPSPFSLALLPQSHSQMQCAVKCDPSPFAFRAGPVH